MSKTGRGIQTTATFSFNPVDVGLDGGIGFLKSSRSGGDHNKLEKKY